LRDRIWEPVLTYAAKYKMSGDLAKLKVLIEAERGNPQGLPASSLAK
jgi:hypothetical protein